MELSFQPLAIELNLGHYFFPRVNTLCMLEATSGLLVNHITLFFSLDDAKKDN